MRLSKYRGENLRLRIAITLPEDIFIRRPILWHFATPWPEKSKHQLLAGQTSAAHEYSRRMEIRPCRAQAHPSKADKIPTPAQA
jgi:hypothetical protein